MSVYEDTETALYNYYGIYGHETFSRDHYIANNYTDDQHQAFAHAYTSAMVTVQHSALEAELIGNAREARTTFKYYYKGGSTEYLADTYRDLYNNQVGREIGKYAKANGLTQTQIADLVDAALADTLIVSLSHPEIPPLENSYVDFWSITSSFGGWPGDFRAPPIIWTPPTGSPSPAGGILPGTHLLEFEGGSYGQVTGQATLNGSSLDDVLFALDGSATIKGGNGDDLIVSNVGQHDFDGEAGDDNLFGNAGADILKGGAGNDLLYGQDGHDKLIAGADFDILDGGAGNDYLDTSALTDRTAAVILREGGGHDVLSGMDGVGAIRFEGIDTSDISLVWDYDVGVVQQGSVTSYFLDGEAAIKINATGDTIYLPHLSAYYDVDRFGGHYGYFQSVFPLYFDDATIQYWEQVLGNPWEVASQALPAEYKSALFDHQAQRGESGSNQAPSNATLTGNAVPENSANGTVAGTVAGSDPDAGALLTYSLTNTAGGRFTINAASGQLTVANGTLLDYEAATSHAITVRVTDQGGLTFDKAFTIGVTDVNEATNHAPTNATLTGGSVAENAANGTAAGTVAGVDPDAGNTFTYSLTNNAGGRFAIHAASGQITVANGTLLDYEAATSHAVTVRVTDQGGLTFDKAFTITLTNLADGTLTGTAGNDTLTSNGQMDTIIGLGGNDALTGDGTNDTLIGGTGNDNLSGQWGDDTYVYTRGDGSDVIGDGSYSSGDKLVFTDINPAEVTLSRATDSEDLTLSVAGGGSVLLDGQFNSVAPGIEAVEFADNTVWSHAQIKQTLLDAQSAAASGSVYGFADSGDTLVAGLGGKSLSGSWGADTYVYARAGGDATVNDGSYSGGDTLLLIDINPADVVLWRDPDYALTLFVLGASSVTLAGQYNPVQPDIETMQFANGTVWTHASLQATLDQQTASGIVVLPGTPGNDTLTGAAAMDILIGRAGNDTLNGGAGNDRIYGGAGNDTMDAGIGNDVIFGDAGDDVIDGGDGDDTLNGGIGNDTMDGGIGNDLYSVDGTGDVVSEAPGAGTDRVNASVSYTLAAGQEIETLSTSNTPGTAPINLTGNGFANSLIGNAGDNVLNGGAGNDTMDGRGGNDLCYVDSAGDVVIEAPGGGTDRVHAIVSYALAGGQEIETLSTSNTPGTAPINLTGNGFANSLIGNAGPNFLNGGGGADVIATHGGNDTIRFNTALGASNIDQITDFDVANDIIQLENAIFIELTTLAGNALSGGEFFVGAAAHDAGDRIIYNSATGALIYDSNGNGANGATQFATLATGLGLTSADFFVV